MMVNRTVSASSRGSLLCCCDSWLVVVVVVVAVAVVVQEASYIAYPANPAIILPSPIENIEPRKRKVLYHLCTSPPRTSANRASFHIF